MKRINIVFDDNLDDVDILSVPDFIADNIEQITQQFFNWVADPNNSKRWTYTDQSGRTVLGIGTEEFLWWLNNILSDGDSYAAVYREHTAFRVEYPSAEF